MYKTLGLAHPKHSEKGRPCHFVGRFSVVTSCLSFDHLGLVFNLSVGVHPLQSGCLLRVLGDLFSCRAVFSSALPCSLDNCNVYCSAWFQRTGVHEDPVLSDSFSTLMPSTVCTECRVLLKMLMITVLDKRDERSLLSCSMQCILVGEAMTNKL